MKSRLECICWARLPRAGLGNKLFVWARGRVFATLNQMPFYATGFNKLRIGPLLRREIGRYYFGQFSAVDALALRQKLRAKLFLARIHDPPVSAIVDNVPKLYVFSRVPHWRDFFEHIRDHRETVRRCLFEAIAAPVRQQLENLPAPVVSVHVRHGDFRRLKPGEDFARVGLVRTPIEYFKNVIDLIRSIAGERLPVTIFSDGAPDDLEELLALPNVTFHRPQAAIIDLLLMSRSKILVPSVGSTFSYWAAFLSEAAVLLHPKHIHAPIRPLSINSKFFEGPTPPAVIQCPTLLRDNIRSVSLQSLCMS